MIMLERGIGSVETGTNRRGQKIFKRVDKLVRPEDGRPSRVFVIRNYTVKQMEALIARERAKGAIWSAKPSLDQRRLVT